MKYFLIGFTVTVVAMLALGIPSSGQVATSNACSTSGAVMTYNSTTRTFECGSPFTTQYVTPSTGATVSVSGNRETVVLINPSGTIATLTVNLPSTPTDGDRVTLSSSQIITALTVGNGTIVGTLTSLVLGGYARFQYNSTASIWFRIG